MAVKTRGWTPERRRKQAKRCKKLRPWTKSTGPKTQNGKDKAKHNAYKHGLDSVDGLEFRKLLTMQRLFVKRVKESLKDNR